MVVPKHIGYWDFSHHRVPAKIRDPEQRFEDEENHQYRGQPFTDLVENSFAIHLTNLYLVHVPTTSNKSTDSMMLRFTSLIAAPK